MRKERKWGTRRRGGRRNLSQVAKTKQKKGRQGGQEDGGRSKDSTGHSSKVLETRTIFLGTGEKAILS